MAAQPQYRPQFVFKPVVQGGGAPGELFQVTTGAPERPRMSASWGSQELVGKGYTNAPFMGPSTRKEEMVTRGLGSTSAAPGAGEVISQTQTRNQIRNVLPVGSVRAAGRPGRRTSFY